MKGISHRMHLQQLCCSTSLAHTWYVWQQSKQDNQATGKVIPSPTDCCEQMEPNEATERVDSTTGAQETPWMVNKFGGTSVASAEAMREVKDIIMGQVDM